MAFNKQPLENTEPKSEKSEGAFSPKPQTTPKTSGGISSQPKSKVQPTLNRQKSHELSGSKMQPGSPSLNVKNTPVGIQQKPFESQKRMDKRTNKLFAKTGQPTLGVWGRDKNHNEFAGPDKIKFNPTFDKTKEINQSLANRQKIVNQGFSPATKPAQKYKWSEGLSDDDNTTLNNALNKVAAWGGEKDLSKANKQWGQDLGYQLRNDGLDEENANRLSEHFLNNAPEYSEVFPGAGESPDVPHDEDWERSWGPEETEEDRLEREEASKLFGTDLNKPAFQTGGFTKADLIRSGEDLSDYELQDDFTDMNDNPLYRLTEEGLNNKKIYNEIIKNVDRSKDAFSQRLQINSALEEYRQRHGGNSVPKKVEERLMR